VTALRFLPLLTFNLQHSLSERTKLPHNPFS
jgi:hypothetical protein